jgi:hypothetical protein
VTFELDRLVEMMSPPTVYLLGIPWDQSASDVGLQFPAGYREFIDRYGPGVVNDELNVYAPIPDAISGRPPGIRGFVARTTDDIGPIITDSREEWPEEYPFPMYPEPGGLLLWADSPNGGFCFWSVDGPDPDRWPIVVWVRQMDVWQRFDGGFLNFLTAVVSRDYPNWPALIGSRWTELHWVTYLY